MGQPKFTISLLGFDERSADHLSQATRMTMGIIDPISKNDTQVVVVDLDGSDGIAIWDEFRKQWPHMPAVVAASDDPDIDDASFAEKPFTVEALIDCITEAIILSPSAEETSNDAEETTPEDEALEFQPVSEKFAEITTGSEEQESGALVEAFDQLNDFSLEMDAADTVDAAPVEVEDTPAEADETAPVDEELDFQPVLEEATDITTEPEIDEGVSLDESSDLLDDFSLELITTDTEDSPPAEEILNDASDVVAETEGVDEEVVHDDNPDAIDILEASDESVNVPDSESEMPPLAEIAGQLATNSSINSAISSRTLDIPNPDESFFDPDAHMIGLVLKGISEGERTGAIAKLACLLDRTIYIDVRKKLVSSNLKDIHMRQIAIAPLGKGETGLDTELEMIESKSFEELSGSEYSICSIETFVWELTILTSKGRAPIGTPIDEPTYLMQWPNFTRLMQIPNDMKVAAYWLRMPSSLKDLSSNLNVPINDILMLYSAASLTGLAGIGKRKSDHMLRPGKPEVHKNRSLFGSIIDRLSKN